jgi:hypothetical protein
MFQSWEDVLKLSTEFAETFGSLPDDIQFNVDSWKDVRKFLILTI